MLSFYSEYGIKRVLLKRLKMTRLVEINISERQAPFPCNEVDCFFFSLICNYLFADPPTFLYYALDIASTNDSDAFSREVWKA